MADATKARGQLMDWTLLDDTGGTFSIETPVLDSGENQDSSMSTILNVVMAHADGNDAGSNYASFKVLGRVDDTDEGWREISNLQATGGTAAVGDLDQESASAQPNVYIVSTTSFETPGDCYLLKDEDTITNSQLVYNKDFANDDYTVMIDNLVNTFSTDDNLYDIVNQWQIRIPFEYQEVKVIFYNTDGDATYVCRVDYLQVTDIE